MRVQGEGVLGSRSFGFKVLGFRVPKLQGQVGG